MAQQRHFQMGSSNAGGGQLGDTTYTKIFVGGLAWETQRDTMKRYFEQFGEIQEAVVITDKSTGRSKGYGFVTFKDPESAKRACYDPTPMIDGRRANCNLAVLGAASHRPRPLTPQQGFGRYRNVMGSSAASAYHGSSSAASTGYFHHPAQYTFPYSVYGYSGGYSQENVYPMSYYGISGGGHHQFSPYDTGAATGHGIFHGFYNPYYAQYGQSSHGGGSSGDGFGLQYPHMLQYPYFPQQYTTGILSLPSSSIATTTGVMAAAVPVRPNISLQTAAPTAAAAAAAEQKSKA